MMLPICKKIKSKTNSSHSFLSLWSFQLFIYKRLTPQIWDKSQQKNFSGLTHDWKNQKAHEKQVILWLKNIYICLKLDTFQHL